MPPPRCTTTMCCAIRYCRGCSHPCAARLEIDILVPHEGAKHSVVGSAGAGIAFIHDQAQADLQHMWGRPVDLLLRVGVAKK